MIDARNYSVVETLRDGSSVTIRAVHPDDKDRILEAFSTLKPESIYFRLFRYKTELTADDLKTLTEVDFRDVVALVVTAGSATDEMIIGAGRYNAYDVPAGGRQAELGFMVKEAFQGKGIASMILRHLISIARDQGLLRLEATVLPDNSGMLAVFARTGLPMTKKRQEDVVCVTLDLKQG